MPKYSASATTPSFAAVTGALAVVGELGLHRGAAELLERQRPGALGLRLLGQLGERLVVGLAQVAVDGEVVLEQVAPVGERRRLAHDLGHDLVEERVVDGQVARAERLREHLEREPGEGLVAEVVARAQAHGRAGRGVVRVGEDRDAHRGIGRAGEREATEEAVAHGDAALDVRRRDLVDDRVAAALVDVVLARQHLQARRLRARLERPPLRERAAAHPVPPGGVARLDHHLAPALGQGDLRLLAGSPAHLHRLLGDVEGPLEDRVPFVALDQHDRERAQARRVVHVDGERRLPAHPVERREERDDGLGRGHDPRRHVDEPGHRGQREQHDEGQAETETRGSGPSSIGHRGRLLGE
jgi:hypothetical protein